MKAVFDTKADSGYDDDIARQYHFPATRPYLEVAQAAVGDWIIYREPQRNRGRKAYIATARVVRVERDPRRVGHAYAFVEYYLEFDRPVPLHDGDGFREEPLRAVANPSLVGQAIQGKSLRPLAQHDFAAIVMAGLTETLEPDNALRLELDPGHTDAETLNLIRAPLYEQERRTEQILLNRKVRDANFRRQVTWAYDDRCAVTGIRIINGGGKSEVQAAHIWPVAAGGPDTVQNGLALSATIHWLFDRHLISLTDDYGLLVSHNKVPSELRVLFDKQLERIQLPADTRSWPNRAYVARHRERFAAAA